MSRRSLADLLGRSVPVTPEFMARWCGISVDEAEAGLRELEAQGFIRRVGRDEDGTHLYALGPGGLTNGRD